MKPLILLDIDGVLNPVARPVRGSDRPQLILSDAKVALVRRLAHCGRIAWVSTWPADMTAGLENAARGGTALAALASFALLTSAQNASDSSAFFVAAASVAACSAARV